MPQQAIRLFHTIRPGKSQTITNKYKNIQHRNKKKKRSKQASEPVSAWLDHR